MLKFTPDSVATRKLEMCDAMENIYPVVPQKAGKRIRLAFVLAMLLSTPGFDGTAQEVPLTHDPVRIIFDTDLGNDVDDVMALAMLHALESRGHCQLLAVTCTKDHPLSAALVDAINTFYDRGEIPVGVVRNGATPEEGSFLRLARETRDKRQRYPHDLVSGEQAPEATGLLRQILSAQPDSSVVIAQVGFSTNLARLLASPPDAHSPLAGEALVKQKVKLLSIMAGSFRPVPGAVRHVEYNVIQDLPSARKVVDQWPTPVVWSGFEIGIAISYPHQNITQDFNYVADHPVAASYQLYCEPEHDRPCWDLTSVLYGIFPESNYFELSPPGHIILQEDGHTMFEEHPEGTHRYLFVNRDQIVRVREALVQLVSQPPQKPEP